MEVLGEGEDGKREMGNVASVIMLPISSSNFQLGIGIGYWQHFHIGNIIQWCCALEVNSGVGRVRRVGRVGLTSSLKAALSASLLKAT